ncbi:serine protease HTRA1-like [Dunckerocampus dactyliophorus]|uniref:serine protease HTRA1-like n=1 Tax=Dunckerocampus dactyliophorus TaxID=161453 RepID=UPI0024062544|nr:serine protease HTRA1-like [Dunckerocampus dactyliophorus]
MVFCGIPLFVIGGILFGSLVGPSPVPGPVPDDFNHVMPNCLKYTPLNDMLEKVTPSVVHIKLYHNPPNPEQEVTVTSTSGFIVSEDGLIVTKAHTVVNEDQIKVDLMGGALFDAKVKLVDEAFDIALIKINTATSLPFLLLDHMTDLRFGEFVVAIGRKSPHQLNVVTGIVKGEAKEMDLQNSDILYIKTDIVMDPSNSGGPLVNLDGQVVGMNTRRVMSFSDGAIPSFKISELLAHAKGGNGNKKYIGMKMMSLTPALAAELKDRLKDFPDVISGAYIVHIFGGTPAEAAGLRYRDVIVAVNGKSVKSASDVDAAMMRDDTLLVVVKRGNEDVNLSIVPKEIDP